MGWFLFGHIAILHNKGTTQIQVETRNTHHRREFFRVQFLGFLWGTLPLIMISVTYLVSSLSLSHTFVLPSLDISRREREK